ncbi:MAG: hypothetical protein Q9171_005105 [Xanthocarpia ochracea]
MSGSGFLGPHNNGPPPPPPRCRVYFYAWTCGHREWIYYSDCDVEGPPSSHLGHPHQERQLPAPRHRCPRCGQHPPHELARGPLLGENLSELARQSITTIRQESNEPAIIRARVAQDVAAVLDPWSEPAVTDDVTTGALQTMVGLSILQDREDVLDDQRFSRDLMEGRDPTPRATTAEILQRLSPMPNGLAQPQADWRANGPVQPAPPHHGGHGLHITTAVMADTGSWGVVERSEVSLPVALVAPVAPVALVVDVDVGVDVLSTVHNLVSHPNSGMATRHNQTGRTGSSNPKTTHDVEKEDAHVTVGFDTRFDLCSIYKPMATASCLGGLRTGTACHSREGYDPISMFWLHLGMPSS